MQISDHKRRNPAWRGLGFDSTQTNGLGLPIDYSPADALIPRLEAVRQVGPGWIALCPAHDDRNPSLSVREAGDGTILLRCHAGCSALEVVQAVGLELSDLFPRRFERAAMTRPERAQVDRDMRITRQWAALNAILPELAFVEVAAASIAKLSADDVKRVALAHGRIQAYRLSVSEVLR